VSIKITGSRSIKSANTAGPWNGQTAASARLRFMVPTGAIVNNIPLLISRDVYASILIAILSSPTAGSFRIKVYVVSAAGVDNIREVTLAQGVVYDLGVRHNGTTGSQTLLVDAVEYGIGSFTGATGPVAFDEFGDTKSKVITIYKVESGKWATVKTVDVSNG